MYVAKSPLATAVAGPAGIHWRHTLVVRQDPSSPTNGFAEETSPTSTSEAPFFTSGSIGGQSNPDDNTDVAKTALEWVFAVVALVIIVTVTTWRYTTLRRRKQSLRAFLSRRNGHSDSRDHILNTQERRGSLPRTTGLPRPRTLSGASLPIAESLFYPPSLVHGRYPEPLEPAPVHLAYSAALPTVERGRRGRRAVRGADTDACGRRGGRVDSDDWDGDDKDELPAYETVAVAGPPRYADVDVHCLGGVPLRALTVLPESNHVSLSPERASRHYESTDRLNAPSPDSRHSINTSESPASRSSNNADQRPGPGTNSSRTLTSTTIPSNFLPC